MLQALSGELSPHAGGALAPLRAAGRAALAGARLPSSRDEAFRFTDMAPLAQARPARAVTPSPKPSQPSSFL